LARRFAWELARFRRPGLQIGKNSRRGEPPADVLRRRGVPVALDEAIRYTCTMVQARKRRIPPAAPRSPREAAACCQPVDGLLDPALFRALGDATRVLILGCLIKCGRACGVGEIAECCSVDLSVVSRHLQTLDRAGLVESNRCGRTRSYLVRYAALCSQLRGLADAIEECAPSDAAVGASSYACTGDRRGGH